MKVTQAPMMYRPITIILETQDDFDELTAVLLAVARDRIHYSPGLRGTAKDLYDALVPELAKNDDEE